MAKSACLATSEAVRDEVSLALGAGASALGAVLAGYFRAAGTSPGVLFSPFTLLVGGLGSGIFAYDGRCRQPGKEAKRPRGFLPEDSVPAAARVAAPASVAAAAVACAFHPGTSFLSAVRPGISAAKEVGSKGRKALLEVVASRGATAFTDPTVRKALVTQFGSVEGGLITPGDLTPPENIQLRALRGEEGWRTPWDEDALEATVRLGTAHAIIAGDSKGLFACLGYYDLPSGPELYPYEVYAACLAEPVLRGVTRLGPGVPIPTPNGLGLGAADGGDVPAAWAKLPSGTVLRLDRDLASKEITPRRTTRD